MGLLRSPAPTPAGDVVTPCSRANRVFEREPFAAQEQTPALYEPLPARRQIILLSVQRQVRRPRDPLDDEGSERLQRPLAMPTHLLGGNRSCIPIKTPCQRKHPHMDHLQSKGGIPARFS